ncbi:hypothetical protein [Exiguobacterium sp. s127]|uniref:DUF6932 family protein n=1 Tax=Exiguobacterium sp. s127 TaxID=2751210 RepID=UPI001BE8616C|nr:hypothetical protein [Exiguobacterium sp. s127]
MNEEGILSAGIHELNLDDFYEMFCFNSCREKFKNEFEGLMQFVKTSDAQFLFIGGSFVTYKINPKDLDCLIVYPKRSDIPSSKVKGLKDLDIQYASSDFPNSVDAYLHLFSHDSSNVEKGIVQVKIGDTSLNWNVNSFREKDYQEVKNLYYLYSKSKK